MDSSNIINLALLVVAVIAAVVAIVQVKEARAARIGAEKADESAGLHERRALEAAEASASSSARSAQAQERLAEVAELTARPPDPWAIEQVGRERWKVTNNTGANVDSVAIGSNPEGIIQPEQGDQVRKVPKGQSLYFLFGGGMADPASVNLKVVWRDATGTGQEFYKTVP